MRISRTRFVLFTLSVLFLISESLSAQTKKPITFEEVMRFKSIKNQIISENGSVVAYSVQPERGDPSALFYLFAKDTTLVIHYGVQPVISKNSEWGAAALSPKLLDLENTDKGKDKPKNGLAIVRFSNFEVTKFTDVDKYLLSNDSHWLAYKLYASENSKSSDKKNSDDPKKKKNPFATASELRLRHLDDGSEIAFQGVTEFAFDSTSNYLVYSIEENDGKRNGVYFINLISGLTLPTKIISEEKSHYSNLNWNNKYHTLAFISAKEKSNGDADSCCLNIWETSSSKYSRIVESSNYPSGWILPFKNNLKWTTDGNRLYFGFKPWTDTIVDEDKIKFNDSTLFDITTILKKTELDLWHYDDGRIKTHQKNWWKENKDNTYAAVWHRELKRFTQLADSTLPIVEYSDNPTRALGSTEIPYLKEITWDDSYRDVYVINLLDGSKRLVIKHTNDQTQISPLGQFVAYFSDKHWWLYDTRLDTNYSITKLVDVPFYNEDHDKSSKAPSYGIAGWIEDDDAVLIYDKYDVWKFYTHPEGSYLNQSYGEGRHSNLSLRIIQTDPEKTYYKRRENVFMSGFNHKTKETGIYTLNLEMLGPMTVYHEDDRLNIIARAKYLNRFIFTKEKYDMFPDLWVSDSTFKMPRKISDVNPQMKDYLWGKAELIEYVSTEGDTLSGFIIKPDNYIKGKLYPVIVYFYERFAQTFHNFYQPLNNHRPCFPFYSGEDYVILLPDIKYRVGFPGPSALNCIVPAVRKLIDNGIADSNAIGLWGHSWSGYQAVYMITKTNLFSATVAGAAVGNMTSAYSGIRLESGMARQFQYEKDQSRIGGTLWDSLNNYILNSPVFQLKSMTTPLLLEFGDEDNAVPWQQGIEIYMAARRLGKTCYMLEYRGEPHIPQKYANKLDYAIRMKEFYDFYLKKKPAPDWILHGIEYKGK